MKVHSTIASQNGIDIEAVVNDIGSMSFRCRLVYIDLTSIRGHISSGTSGMGCPSYAIALVLGVDLNSRFIRGHPSCHGVTMDLSL